MPQTPLCHELALYFFKFTFKALEARLNRLTPLHAIPLEWC